MNTNQKSMRYDQNDYDALLHSKIPAALVETPQMNFDDDSDASVFFARELDYVKSQSYDVEYPEFTALKLSPVKSTPAPRPSLTTATTRPAWRRLSATTPPTCPVLM